MKVFEQIQQLQQIHKLIAAGQTGTPEEFAQKLDISPRRLYDILDELKSRGAPIAYSRSAQNYFYTEAFQLDITCRFRRLSSKEQEDIFGGYFPVNLFPYHLFYAVKITNFVVRYNFSIKTYK